MIKNIIAALFVVFVLGIGISLIPSKTYSQNQYDVARVHAYKKGHEDGMRYVSAYWAGEIQHEYIRQGGK